MNRYANFMAGSSMTPSFPTGIAPTSALLPYQKSPVATNTSSRTDAGRLTYSGQLLPSQNGFAPSTYSRLFTGTPTRVGY